MCNAQLLLYLLKYIISQIMSYRRHEEARVLHSYQELTDLVEINKNAQELRISKTCIS